jgi:hypothetical protein
MIEEKGLCILVGDIRKKQEKQIKRERIHEDDETTPREKKEFTKKRQIKWEPHTHYKCIKESTRVMKNIDEINSITFPQEEDFCIYINTKECASRDRDVPLYEAAYKCQDGTLIRVQINHLKRAYTQSGKKDIKRAWEVDEDSGIPYWVDRYAYSKNN